MNSINREWQCDDIRGVDLPQNRWEQTARTCMFHYVHFYVLRRKWRKENEKVPCGSNRFVDSCHSGLINVQSIAEKKKKIEKNKQKKSQNAIPFFVFALALLSAQILIDEIIKEWLCPIKGLKGR